MQCQHVTLPGGARAIVCSSGSRKRCPCGHRATLLCDWKMPAKGKTCDAPLCASCSTSPAPEKDLCRDHAEAWKAWKASR